MLAAEMGEVIQDAPPIRVAGCALTWELGSCWKHQKGLFPPWSAQFRLCVSISTHLRSSHFPELTQPHQ